MLEMLLSVAIIALIAAIGAPVYLNFQTRNDLDIAAQTFTQGARRAQALSRAMEGDSSWGTHLASGSVTVFKGASYAARDAAVDETYDIASSITFSGTTDYVFAKLTGLPAATGSTTLTSVNNETRTIALNAKGTVTY